eukprot:RCo013728
MADPDADVLADGLDELPDSLLNKKNRELKQQIRFYEQEVENKQKEVVDHKQRLTFMTEHLANVNMEIKNIQDLCMAKKRETETEDHMAQLAERNAGRVKSEIKSLAQQKMEIQEKLDDIQNAIFKGNLKMDEFKSQMSFNQEELEQWDLARKQKEDDAFSLFKYHRTDDAKVKELTLTLEKLSRNVLEKKKELEKEITETQTTQIELDKTAEDFRALHAERQDLIKQWEEAIQAMHRRDEAIKKAGEQFAEGKAWHQKRTEQLQDRAAFLNIEVQNNKEMENKIAQEERVLAKYRQDNFLISQHLRELDDELEVVKNTLAKATVDLNARKSRRTALDEQLQQRNTEHAKMMANNERTTLKLKKEAEAAGDMEKQAKLVSDMLAETEDSFRELEKQMTALKAENYQKSQELFAVRKTEANYLAEISGAQAQNKNMQAKVAQLDQESFKQHELLYNIEFQVQQMERKVNRARGERTEEEKKELKEKINMLQTMLDDLQKQHKVLDLQVKRVADDVRQSKMLVDQKNRVKDSENDRILDFTLENESCQLELGRLTKQKQMLLVNHDVLKLQIRRLERDIEQASKGLFSLENRKAQLQITIEEREAEISVHKDLLKLQMKTIEDERKVVVSELRERQSQVGHLRNRFQVLISRISTDPEDPEGTMTHAQYIVKIAKEREQLQATGDGLDEEIKTMEKEARKLDKTIDMLKSCNSQFKSQFKRAGQDAPEAETKRQLEAKNRELQAIVSRRTTDMKEYLKTEMGRMSELQAATNERQLLLHKVSMMKEGLEGLNKGVHDAKEVVRRLHTAIAKLRRSVDEAVVRDATLLERRELNNQVLMALQNVVTSGPESAHSLALFQGLLHRYDIEAPVPTSARSDTSRPSSTVSSSSSAVSAR